jgi:hypothetical protein
LMFQHIIRGIQCALVFHIESLICPTYDNKSG